MDSKHTPNDVPYKLSAQWFGPFRVLEVRGAQAILDLPPSFGKTHNRINMSRLTFFEARDAELGEGDTASEPLLGHDGVMHYEISVFVMLVHTKKCVNFGWSGRGTTSRRTVGYPSCRMYLPWCGPLNGIRPTSHLECQHQNGRLWFPGLCRWCQPRDISLPHQRWVRLAAVTS